jgi:hypothetical protein
MGSSWNVEVSHGDIFELWIFKNVLAEKDYMCSI